MRTESPHHKHKRISSDAGGNAAVADKQFEVVFSTNPLAMYICHEDTLQFLEVNAAPSGSTAIRGMNCCGMKITEIRPAEDVPGFLDSIRKNGTAPTGVGHVRHRRKNGEVFDVDVTSQKISFGGQDAVLVVTQDISERRAAEAETGRARSVSQAR